MPCDFINCLFDLNEVLPKIEVKGTNPYAKNPRVNKMALFSNYLFDINRKLRFDALDLPLLSKPSPYFNLPVLDLEKFYGVLNWRGHRRNSYLNNIKTIATEQMIATKSYQKTAEFINTEGPNIADYKELVNLITRYALNKEGGASDEHYFALIHNATAHALDQLVFTNKNKLQAEKTLKSIFSKLSKKNIDFKRLLFYWKPQELKNATKAKVINEYLKFLKTDDS